MEAKSMNASEYTQVRRLDAEPTGRYVAPADREAALRDALRDVDLGAHDEKIIKWAVSFMDDSTMKTLVSLIERARLAGGAR
jgi:hypothetical protein